MDEHESSPSGRARDRVATRRDLDAGIRDRMADDEMPDAERAARAGAARDRMAAMQDRQAAAQELAELRRQREPDPPGPDV